MKMELALPSSLNRQLASALHSSAIELSHYQPLPMVSAEAPKRARQSTAPPLRVNLKIPSAIMASTPHARHMAVSRPKAEYNREKRNQTYQVICINEKE